VVHRDHHPNRGPARAQKKFKKKKRGVNLGVGSGKNLTKEKSWVGTGVGLKEGATQRLRRSRRKKSGGRCCGQTEREPKRNGSAVRQGRCKNSATPFTRRPATGQRGEKKFDGERKKKMVSEGDGDRLTAQKQTELLANFQRRRPLQGGGKK